MTNVAGLRHNSSYKMSGQTLDATALVHEAYLRLVGPADPLLAEPRHFFAAAAQAMRRILVDQAAARKRSTAGDLRIPEDRHRILNLPMSKNTDELLERSALADPAAELIASRFFVPT